jgi:hypothetical protein
MVQNTSLSDFPTLIIGLDIVVWDNERIVLTGRSTTKNFVLEFVVAKDLTALYTGNN